jgi:acetoin utilization protein AcuB
MSHPVISVQSEMPIQEALNLMRREKIRRAPVVDKRGKLIGIVSETDLLHASPSDVTSLSVWELNYLLSKITVNEVMTKEALSVSPDTPVEVAARMMVDNVIGGMPVLREGEVVGMITETDLFKLFLEMLGARYPGVRVTAEVPNQPGELAKVTAAIHSNGGNILALTTALGESTETAVLTIKVEGIESDKLRNLLAPLVENFIDFRETGSG